MLRDDSGLQIRARAGTSRSTNTGDVGTMAVKVLTGKAAVDLATVWRRARAQNRPYGADARVRT